MRVDGPSRRALQQAGDVFSDLVMAGVRQALNVYLKDFGYTSTVDDLGIIRTVFNTYTEETLLPHLGGEWVGAAAAQQRRLDDALTAAPVPEIENPAADAYLASASNRLKGISDEVWQHTRTALLTGQQAGESIQQLAARVRATASVAEPRATVIARTEVVGAHNRGSLEQIKATGYTHTKTWLATGDERTRPTHRQVNGSTVTQEEKFDVGGYPMDGPHDPFGPPGETINCRCTLTYAITEGAPAEGGDGGGE